MLIKNIYVYDDKGLKQLKHVQLTKTGSRIIHNLDDDLSALEQHEENIIDSKDTYFLMPGMMDSHIHGQGGFDFASLSVEDGEKELEVIVKQLGKTGLSYAVPTLVSMPVELLKQSLMIINKFIKNQKINPTPGFTTLVGVHLEGPFISKSCKGAHSEEALQQEISMEKFREIINAAPDIKQWKITLAPDLVGAEEFIKQTKALEAEGLSVKVFIGHANPEEKEAIGRAISAGAAGFTHLGNACQESCSRDNRTLSSEDATSNVVKWVLENPDQCPAGVELILDGAHLSFSFSTLIHQTIKNKIMLVTDALGPTGCKDGLYKLGALDIRKDKNNFYLVDEEGHFKMKMGTLPSGETGEVRTLAGSASSLAQCAQNYFDLLHDEPVESRMDFLYAGLISNPRRASLSDDAINNLPDDTNFVIFNEKGKLILSACNSKLTEHQQILWPIQSLLGNGLLAPPSVYNPGKDNLECDATKLMFSIPTI
ncbi:N-acetylglucosamine-6-phosphate deacetylase [Legionella sp. km535]|uniref:N-acetylglucosamine-6-phosphate deacetylase n=1 Tax=Legionella sp. km535 TaxID=2498107 RepID=UPI000F8D25C6|nr:N-acetylglucosamine-6-phosphate deacetylase [Legionella sp. km535]RUR19427.1 N-acetylglucosamine-6-phosphate deacetylase [Legionella sp. km535]